MKFKFFFILIIFIDLITISPAEQVKIDGIDVRLSKDGNSNNTVNSLSINVGEDFYVHTILKNPDRDADNVKIFLRIYVRDVLVYDRGKFINTDEGVDYEIKISSDEFMSVWDRTFMAYDCRYYQDIRVEVYGDVPKNMNTAELNIDGEKKFDEVRIFPPDPNKNDMIFIYVEGWVNKSDYKAAESGGEPLENAYVVVTNLGENQRWDSSDDYDTFKTDGNGMVRFTISKQREFRDRPYGKYQIIVLEKKSWDDYGDYCRYAHTFIVGRYINISIDPETPEEEEDIEVRVIDDENISVPSVLLTVSGIQGIVLQTRTNKNGVAHIRINESGIYTINALREGCEECANSVSKWFEVKGKGRLKLDIYPEIVEVGKDVIIEVFTEDGKRVRNANVIITLPDGEAVNGTPTSPLGVSSYIPMEFGEYKVTVYKKGYKRTTKNFTAYNSFFIDIPNQIKINRAYILYIKNQLNNPVPNATVLLEKLYLSKTNLTWDDVYNESFNFSSIINKTELFFNISKLRSDMNGRVNITINESGLYRVRVTKKGYKDLVEKIIPVKPLMVKLSSKRIDLDKSVTIFAADLNGSPVYSMIEITKPNKRIDKKRGSSFRYKPMLSGNYSVRVTSRGYSEEVLDFEVLPYPVEINAEVRGNYLVISINGGGKPLSRSRVEVITPDYKKIEVYTDDKGTINLDLPALNRKGNFTIRVNKRNYEKKEIIKEVTKWGGFTIESLIFYIFIISIAFTILFYGYRYYKKRTIKRRLKRLKRRKIRRY